jgi:hypothetical protein
MTEAESLEAERTTIYTTLAQLAGVIDMSEGGRSVSVSTTRDSLTRRLEAINLRLAQLSGPFVITSTGRQ